MPAADITKRVISDTMKTLMEKESLAKISVGDIAAACGITRNSFYYHFKDKYDLVNWIFYTEASQALGKSEAENLPTWSLLETVCTLLYENKAFYKNALSVTGQNSFLEYFNELMKEIERVRLAELFNEDDEAKDFCITFYANAFVDSISRWLTGGAAIPPDKFTRLLRKTVTMTAKYVEWEDEDEK